MKDEFEIRGIQKSKVADFSIVLQDVVGWLDSNNLSICDNHSLVWQYLFGYHRNDIDVAQRDVA